MKKLFNKIFGNNDKLSMYDEIVENRIDSFVSGPPIFEDITKKEIDPYIRKMSNQYFATMEKLQEAIKSRDYLSAGDIAKENIKYIPEFIKEMKHDLDRFSVTLIPALEQGGTILALLNDRSSLEQMLELVTTIPELERWIDIVKRHFIDLDLFKDILRTIEENPGCVQTDIKKLANEPDVRKISNLISYLEKDNRIKRVKIRNSYNLYIKDEIITEQNIKKKEIGSHRKSSKSPSLKEINIDSLEYIPLPRAPLKWEEKRAQKQKKEVEISEGFFKIKNATWNIVSIEKVPEEEKPDTAYRQVYPINSGVILVDDLGNSLEYQDYDASAIKYNIHGNIEHQSGLLHGVYRLGIHPYGNGLISMSKDCVIHAYNEKLQLLFESSLLKSPEIVKFQRKFDIPLNKLKNHIRCVSLSQDNHLYLFTIVDEAWCITNEGEGMWGRKIPIQAGWAEYTSPSSYYGTSEEVFEALELMELSLPVSPDNLKKKYRELSKQWHPDVNPNDPSAVEKMQNLNSAISLLTGLNLQSSAQYNPKYYTKSFNDNEIQAADWIYAASFAAQSNGVYLASYSGRIIALNEKGEGLRVYDIGSVPRRIIDSGEYLYLLTDTRLYVLKNDTLFSLIDVLDGGEFIPAKTGFGLLEKKRFRWYSKDGKYQGSILSKNPIRRIYSTDKNVILETRQRRVILDNIPLWWE